ncbi:glucosidase [Lithospermum erythrorhizon]|uniref:Glucosidase n=1 Tax=Lithospermum erythrorhizon TaxID=34254 RepID=A0AAV3PF46_LITER
MMKHFISVYFLLFLGVVYCQPPISCDITNPSTRNFPFCNKNVSIQERAKDLVSRLTLDEKISQLVNAAPAIERLNISAYEWWSEALHGVSRHGKGIRFNGTIKAATMFPQIIHSAASFDTHLWYRIAQAIGKEARAMYNEGQAKGMTYWAPNINIFRDPRWGRGQETPGEDPLVVGNYAVSYVRGIQGDSFEGGQLEDGHIQASACCKHFTAHDLDNWNGVNRYTFDAKVTKQDLEDTYQPPFKSCIQQGQATGLMCAYNRVNGVPSCADYNLLTGTARSQWNFKGYIVSDCDAVAIMHDDQGYAKEPEDAVVDVLKAGMDLNCGSYLKKYTRSAVEQNNLSTTEIDRALHNLFSVRMRLGLLNGDAKKQAFGNIGPDVVCSKEHQQLALEAARSGIVLLKNSAGLLPLSKSNVRNLAVIGPNANSSEIFVGNYEGYPCKNITVLQALQHYARSPLYHKGCDYVNCTSAAIDEVVSVAKQADYVVLVMGLDQTQEREKHDRTELVLPGEQQRLIENVAQAAKSPVILVLLTGGPVDISFAKENSKIGSILWAGYPGEAGGIALAETIFGDNNPGGKLPVTWYPKDFINVPMTDMRMRPNASTGYPGRTYRFYTGKPVFEFGFGLSYTKYSYEFIFVTRNKLDLSQSLARESIEGLGSVRYASISRIGHQLCQSSRFPAIVGVTNHREITGRHPVLLFLRDDTSRKGNPIKQLIGFQSVNLSPRQRTEIDFVVNPCEHLSKAKEDGSRVIEEGIYHLIVGGKEYPISIVL